MPLITLLTDFGLADEYVGLMKGVILSINPLAKIIDLTHQIDPQDIVQAAYTIKSSYKYFPKGTIHVLVVDPGVGSSRSVIALEKDGHIFLAPDNGLLALLINSKKDDFIISVDNSKYFLKNISRTFHGRDIFAPVAAHMTNGVKLHEIGSPIDGEKLTQIKMPVPHTLSGGGIKGSVIFIDRFGNLITNIDADLIEKNINQKKNSDIKIILGNKIIHGLSNNYKSVNIQSPLAIIGSKGYLEISVNCGNAKQYFKAQKGDKVMINTHQQNHGFIK